MSLLMVNQGEDLALKAFLNHTAPQDLDLCLYKNDKTPADGDTEANYTAADFTGYSVAQLTASSWVVTPGAPSEAAYPQVTFTSTANQSSQNIYGYYVKQRTSGKLMWAERFSDGPYPIANNGDAIKVTPKIQLRKAGE